MLLVQSCSRVEGNHKTVLRSQNEQLQKYTLKYKRILGFYSNKNSDCNQCELGVRQKKQWFSVSSQSYPRKDKQD